MNIPAIDITTTAVNRPEIHDITFSSFTRHLNGVDWSRSTLYINIDPFPPGDRSECVRVAEKYFGQVVANMPDVPNYTAAYNWVWSHAKTKYILNLEDDWRLKKDVHIGTLLQYFDQIPSLYEVVLRAYTYHYPCTCTSPAILCRRYYHTIGGKLDITRNPETQTHSRQDMGLFIPNRNNCSGNAIRKFVVAYPEITGDKRECLVEDIGRDWLDNSKYCRPQQFPKSDPRYNKKCNFVKWEVKR